MRTSDARPHPTRDRRSGMILAMVLVLALILSTAVLAFSRRALIDTMIVRNREKVASTEALARSGVEIAKAVLTEQMWRKVDTASKRGDGEEMVGNTTFDLWAQIGDYDVVTPDGAVLRVDIYDNGARLNLNSLVAYGTRPPAETTNKKKQFENLQQAQAAVAAARAQGKQPVQQEKPKHDPAREGKPIEDAEEFLVDFLDHVIENMDAHPEDKEYDTRELAQNLLDYIDADYTRIDGGDEEDYYVSQEPPYYPADRPLLSVYEIGLVEGFDSNLVEALHPYVTVFPLGRARGVNINTAPPHVLGAVYHGAGGDKRLFNEDDVLEILDVRNEDEVFCDKTELDPDRCITLEQADLEGPTYPPVELPSVTFVYTVIAEARHGDVTRSVEAVINISTPGYPRLVFWRMQ